MDNLKALIYLIAIIAFIIILIRKKALPFFKKKTVGTEYTLSGKEPEVFPRRGKELRYEVLAFGTHNKPDPKDFGNQIEARLECELTRLANRQAVYRVDYVPLGSMLLLFISYEA